VEQGVIRWKELRLIESRRAEAPIFVSPYTSAQTQCGDVLCIDERTGGRRTYTPLVYQVQSVVVAQHFHTGPAAGGIYYYTGDVRELTARSWPCGWLALIEPRGERVEPLADTMGRAEQVYVREMLVFCQCGLSTHNTSPTRNLLTSGLVSWGEDSLIPICEEMQRNYEEYLGSLAPRPAYRFSVVAGAVVLEALEWPGRSVAVA
jgi:hypothetical protein